MNPALVEVVRNIRSAVVSKDMGKDMGTFRLS